MAFTLSFETDNSAFSDDNEELSVRFMGNDEVARILRVIAVKVENGDYQGPVMDANGNKVGEYKWEEKS